MIRLQKQILLTVTGLLSVALLPTVALLTWTARQALLERTKEDGVHIAQMLALSTSIDEQVSQDVEKAIADQMIVSATTAAHLVSIAEAAGLPPNEINTHLKAITNSTYKLLSVVNWDFQYW